MSYEGESLDMSLFRQMYLIVSALPTILLLLTFVLWTMLEGPGAAESTGPDGMPAWQIALFAAIALASLPMALFVRRLGLKATGDVIDPKSKKVLSGPDAVVQRITSTAVVGMAMPEIGLLLGFVACFLTENWLVYLPFAAYTIVGWAIMYPRPSQVRAWYARQTGAEPVPSIIS
ncbi:MAG: hypothetical protein U1E08_03290 [Coriobacteriia bacterium]|nr:hypothetical protein [Coriobacteriia bacterium]